MDLFIQGLFWILAAIALVSGIVVVSHRSPIGSVFALIVNSATLAGLYLLMGDAFLAAIQVIVYSGAILVLFLFVVMLLDIRSDALRGGGRVRAIAVGLLAAGLVGLVGVALWLSFGEAPGPPPPETWGSVASMADVLFGDYVLIFEAVSVLLVSAMVGVVVLTKKGYVPAAALRGPDAQEEGTG